MPLNPFNYEYEWPAIIALFAAVIALYGSWRANKIAEKNLSASVDLEIFRLKERQVSELRDALASFAASASAIRKNEHGHLSREDAARSREYSSKAILLMNSNDEDYELLRCIIVDELGVSSPDEKRLIGDEHLYTVGQRILSRKSKEIENEIRQYNAKNK